MAIRYYIQYPCGKLFELRAPIYIVDANGKMTSVSPRDNNFLIEAKKKFENGKLKVIAKDVSEQNPKQDNGFVSLAPKKKPVD